MHNDDHFGAARARRLLLSSCAGLVALVPNMAVLAIAHEMHVSTGHGGLLKFFVMFVDKPLGNPIGILESPDLLVKALFHVLVGLGMAVVFAEVLYPQGSRWGLRGWVIGLWYGVFIWILNAFVVLPSLGEGIAGLRSVGTRGVVVFAVAHFAFFLVLGVTYSALFRTTWRQSSRQPR